MIHSTVSKMLKKRLGSHSPSRPSTHMILVSRVSITHVTGFVVGLLPSGVADIVWCVDVTGEIALGSVAACFVAHRIVARVVVVVVCEGVGGFFCAAGSARVSPGHA